MKGLASKQAWEQSEKWVGDGVVTGEGAGASSGKKSIMSMSAYVLGGGVRVGY